MTEVTAHRPGAAARWRRAAFAAAFVGCGAAAWAAAPQAARSYEDALTRFEKHDYAGAIVQLKNAIQADPNNLSVQVLLGKALLADSQVAAAEVAFVEALRLGVNRAEVVVPLARALIAQGKQRQVIEQDRYAPAGLPAGVQLQLLLLRAAALADIGETRAGMAAIEAARAIDPQAPEVWLAEVPPRIRARQLAEATAAADKALALAPNLAEALYLRGSVSHVRGDTVGALADYDRALKSDPEHVEALVARAGLLLDLKKPDQAALDVAQLIRSSPKEPRGRYLQALILERKGDAAGSRAALKDVTSLLDPVPAEFVRYRPQLLMLGGLAHYGLDEKEKAKPYLEGVVRVLPTSPVSKLLARIYLSDKNIDRAIESLDAYLRGQPGDAQALQLLASAHMAQGRYVRATQLMQDALKTQDQPNLRALLGLSLVGGGRLGDAVTELEAALRKDPGQLQAGVALTNIYIQTGNPGNAVRVSQGLLKLQPGNPGILNLAGSASAANGDLAGARSAFEQALKADPSFIAPQINLARLDIRTQAYDEASRRLAEVLRVDDKNVDALGEQGRCYELRGQLGDAQRWFEKADDHSGPDNLEPALALVDFLLRNNRPDAAREASRRLTAKAPEAMPVLLALARVNLANGDPVTAKANLIRATSLASYDAPVLVRIALLQLQVGDLGGAGHALEKALTERPDYLPAQALMADVELRQGDIAKAEARARRIVAARPKLGVGHALLGDVASARGQPAAAVDNYRKAHAIDKSTESLLRVYGALGATDPAGAAQLAEQWLKSHPDDAAVRRAVGDGYARAGKFAQARAAYEVLAKQRPGSAEVLNNLANLMLLTQDTGALAMAERALAVDPASPRVLDTVGWIAFRTGQTERGLLMLRDARLRDPGNPEIRFHLASVLAGHGRTAEAKDELQAAVRFGPGFASYAEAQALLARLGP